MEHIEREFKFVIDKLPASLSNPYHIDQYYFEPKKIKKELLKIFNLSSLDDITTYRVRKIKHNDEISYVLTLKSSGMLKRKEYEEIIDEKLFNKIIKQKLTSIIIKDRYVKEIDGYKLEFDYYYNLNIKLITLEIEIPDDDTNIHYQNIINILNNHFDFKYQDVTNDYRYKNSNLIKYFGARND